MSTRPQARPASFLAAPAHRAFLVQPPLRAHQHVQLSVLDEKLDAHALAHPRQGLLRWNAAIQNLDPVGPAVLPLELLEEADPGCR